MSNGYSYHIPNQWQGRSKSLRIIGDKKAAAVTQQLNRDLALLGCFERYVSLPVKIIQMVRNPFDNIATLAKKTKGLEGDLRLGAKYYFDLLTAARNVRRILTERQLLTIRHEELVACPESTLRTTCNWLGLPVEDSYLSACTSVVFDSPRRTRHEYDWPSDLLESVTEWIASNPILSGYSFDDDQDCGSRTAA